MTTATSTDTVSPAKVWVAVARQLGPGFASRAPALDANDTFAADNFKELREHRVFSAGIPAELGGGGASHAELCAVLRELGRHCGATALALSMHTHLVCTNVFQYRQGAPVALMLQRIAAEELMLVTSGASDWLDSSGIAERVDGGFRVSGRKHFVSGSPAGDIFITSAVYDDPVEGPTVLHFSVPMKAEGVTVLDNWRTMAMRPSGSNDVELNGVFVHDAAIPSRRPRGAYPPMLDIVGPIALPLIFSAYLGVADAARELALQQVAKKPDDENVWYILGEMENAYTTGEMAVQSMVDICNNYAFDPAPANRQALIRKTIAADALKLALEKALEAVGGSGIFRVKGLERLVRDIHAAQFHPLQPKRQHRFTGRAILGLDPIG